MHVNIVILSWWVLDILVLLAQVNSHHRKGDPSTQAIR